MKRREFLKSAAILAIAQRLGAEHRPSLLLLSSPEAAAIKAAIAGKEWAFAGAATQLRSLADAALTAGPWSVTFHRPKALDAPLHDYYSEGPYWWPDPANPNGPYIRRDGEVNRGRFTDNRRDLGEMAAAVLALGMAACFLQERRYARHASEILAAWFINEKTRMNPHLEHGQAVIGHNDGRGTGIIDTVSLIHAVEGIALLSEADQLDAGLAAGLRQWFSAYLRWMTTSEKGLAEKNATNNHATWWTAQAAAYACFTGDAATRAMAWDRCRTYLVPRQIRNDGSCPREEARTRSLSYSSMNLDGFSVICRLAEKEGVDLWHFRTPQGVGVETAIRYLRPYVLDPDTWHKRQITRYDQDRCIFLALAGLGLHSGELLRDYRSLPRASAPWVLLTDFIVRISPRSTQSAQRESNH